MKGQWSKTYGMKQKQLYILFGWTESWLWHLGFSIFFMACKIFIYFFSCGMWDLVLWPGIELGLPALGGWSLHHWTTREVTLYLCWFPFSVAETFFFELVISWLSAHNQEVLVTQSCLTLCDPMDCSPLGSYVHGVLQARILEWVATSFSRA